MAPVLHSISADFGPYVAVAMPHIANVTVHDTRHEAITEIAKRIPNAIMLARATGHSDRRVLMRCVTDELADVLE